MEQERTHGYSWWITPQQWPSVFVCDSHDEYLRIARTPLLRRVARDFYLPNNLPENCWIPHKLTTLNQRKQLSRLGEWSTAFSNRPEAKLIDATLRQCYLLQAKERGWLSFKGEVRQQQLHDAFISNYREIIELLDDDFIGEIERSYKGYLAFLFRKRPSRRFPLKHILLINFLFNNIEEFLNIHSEIIGAHAPHLP
jgi:hypothetical protein